MAFNAAHVPTFANIPLDANTSMKIDRVPVKATLLRYLIIGVLPVLLSVDTAFKAALLINCIRPDAGWF
jgi:hypothetical protein